MKASFPRAARFSFLSSAVFALIAISAVRAGAFTIIANFDQSITGDPQAATIENTINKAIQVYEASIADPITVSILFTEMTNGLGRSEWGYDIVAYSDYLAALKSHATSSYDRAALAHLPGGTSNPVNGSGSVNVQLANARALGLTGAAAPGDTDGTVLLNTAKMNLERSNINPGKWDLMSVASHEIDEVLGFGSVLNGLPNGATAPVGNIWPEDLFRYDQNGNRSLDTALATQAYFSLDGTTRLARFNQVGGDDFSDWYGWQSGVIPQVQDEASLAGAAPNLGVEKIALDVIGYTLSPGALAPFIGNMTKTNDAFSFSWAAGPGLVYQAQYTTDLRSTNWIDLGSPVTATQNTQSASDSNGSGPQRFYRVILTP